MDEETLFQMTSSTKLAETLKNGILNLRPSQGGDRSKFHQTLESSLQEISLRITQLCGKLPLGMISHKMSLITIFGHKHFRQKFHPKFDIFHEKISTASDFGSNLV